MTDKFIVSGTYQEFLQYTERKQGDGVFYRYVENVYTIMGLNEIEGYYIGTWRDKPGISDIIQHIAIIKAATRVNYTHKMLRSTNKLIP